MPGRVINLIVVHCSATPNGVKLGKGTQSAARVIDGWHKAREFYRTPKWRLAFNGHLGAIGYHYVIDTDGSEETGRHLDEIGAHVRGYNSASVGICCAGYDKLTLAEWKTLRMRVSALQQLYPAARVVGHRDLSPDLNHDGKITPNEYSKLCPGYSVADWLAGGMQPLAGHIVEMQ